MYGNSVSNVYKNNSVNYTSREQLLLILVDGAVKFAEITREVSVSEDIKKSYENLIKVQDIFVELMISLGQNVGEWAEQIYQVCEFIKTRLFEINLKKDVVMMDELTPAIEDVRNT